MRVEAHDYHAVAAMAPDLGDRGRPAGARTGWVEPAGCRGSRPSRRRRARSWSGIAGIVLHGAAAVPRPQPDHLQVAHARHAGRGRAVGRRAAGRGRLAGDSRRRRQDRGPAASAQGRRAARPRDRARRRGIRHGGRGRRPRGPRRGRLRGIGGPAARSSSSARRPAARPARPRGSRTTSASRRACQATSWPAERCSRRGGSAPRSS